MSDHLYFTSVPWPVGNIRHKVFITSEEDDHDFSLALIWYDLGVHNGHLTAFLEIAEEQWHALPHLSPLFDLLTELSGFHIQPAVFCAWLRIRDFIEHPLPATPEEESEGETPCP